FTSRWARPTRRTDVTTTSRSGVRAREFRKIPCGHALAEIRRETLLLAGDLVGAAGFEKLPAQAAAHADRQIRAVAALLPGAQGHQWRRLFHPAAHARDRHLRPAGHGGA